MGWMGQETDLEKYVTSVTFEGFKLYGIQETIPCKLLIL